MDNGDRNSVWLLVESSVVVRWSDTRTRTRSSDRCRSSSPPQDTSPEV